MITALMTNRLGDILALLFSDGLAFLLSLEVGNFPRNLAALLTRHVAAFLARYL
jgi:hypothetical protein